jgi:excisionase family DNA binding protein
MEWVKVADRNEALDLEVYAYAAAIRSGIAYMEMYPPSPQNRPKPPKSQAHEGENDDQKTRIRQPLETRTARMTVDDFKDGALLRPDQVADIFKVKKKTIYNWIAQGRLTAVVVAGRSLRIRKEAVVACMVDMDE